jgi:hypothetical protein
VFSCNKSPPHTHTQIILVVMNNVKWVPVTTTWLLTEQLTPSCVPWLPADSREGVLFRFGGGMRDSNVLPGKNQRDFYYLHYEQESWEQTGLWSEKLEGRHHFGDVTLDGKIDIKGGWRAFMWFKTHGLRSQQQVFCSHKRWGSYVQLNDRLCYKTFLSTVEPLITDTAGEFKFCPL